MNNQNSYETEEYNSWEKLQQREFQKFRNVKYNLIFNVCTYVLIFVIEYVLAIKSGAEVLKADAFNNLSGVISTFLLIIGVHIASDQDETRLIGFPVSNQSELSNQKKVRLSRFRFETVFTLTTSILMIGIAVKVIGGGINALLHAASQRVPNPIGIVGAVISTVLILIMLGINYFWGKKTNSAALLASAKDSLGDAITSFGTAISIYLMWQCDLKWVDSVASIIIGSFILLSGFEIFLESSLNLVDYFSPRKERQFKEQILTDPAIKAVLGVHAHYDGSLVTVEATVIVDYAMTVAQSFDVAQRIKMQLKQKFEISDAKILFIPNNINE